MTFVFSKKLGTRDSENENVVVLVGQSAAVVRRPSILWRESKSVTDSLLLTIDCLFREDSVLVTCRICSNLPHPDKETESNTETVTGCGQRRVGLRNRTERSLQG